MIKLTMGPSEDGSRLDRLLRKRLPLLGLSAIYGLIRKGEVKVNGRKAKQDHRLKEGEVLEINVGESEFESEARPENSLAGLVKTDFFKRNFNILHEDQSILVCNKPAGLVVHSGSGHTHHDNLVDLATGYILSAQKSVPAGTETEAPVLMHRLDRDTSGVIMLAKNKGIVRALHASMRDGKFTKQYIAVCHNRPPEFEGTIKIGMARNDSKRGGMKMRIADSGPESITTYRILEYQNDRSRLEILIHTGKTHQIRVHMSHLKSPIIGDDRYGDQRTDEKLFASSALSKRLYLHAHKLTFPHPKTGKSITITAPVPKEFARALEK
ncbi:MAG: RluA family pseudouridine synthase [Chitinispirillia bacterium]|nr:RluA family pseudouridine synthase [Chitinispirillia bacterium]MCL2242469.1 RluA family pseudouridine synthase [Chitinispirillia bacterium]